jgi:biopolymer transport protein ExbD
MGMSVGGSAGVKSEPNVVPMIDIMLVLLIIFMLIIPQITAGFDSNPPKGINLTPQKEQDRDQVLGMDRNGNLYWNKKPIAMEVLADTVNAVYSMRDPLDGYVLFIRADKELEYGKVLDVLDIVSRNKVRMTAMISDQQSGTESSVASDRAAEGSTGGPLSGGSP